MFQWCSAWVVGVSVLGCLAIRTTAGQPPMAKVAVTHDIGEFPAGVTRSGFVTHRPIRNSLDGRDAKPELSANQRFAVIPLGRSEFRVVDIQTGALSQRVAPFDEWRMTELSISAHGRLVVARGAGGDLVIYEVGGGSRSDRNEDEIALRPYPERISLEYGEGRFALLDDPGRVVVVRDKTRRWRMDVFEVPGFDVTKKSLPRPSEGRLQDLVVTRKQEVLALHASIKPSTGMSAIRVDKIYPEHESLIPPALRRGDRFVITGDSVFAFLTSYPGGRHMVFPLDDTGRPARQGYGFAIPFSDDLRFTIGNGSVSGRTYAIGTARIIGSDGNPAVVYVGSASRAGETRVYGFPRDIDSVWPLGFVQGEERMVVACYGGGKGVGEEERIRVSLEIVDLGNR